MMREARRKQRDLFEDVTRDVKLRPEVQTKLTPLLQILLAEAAVAREATAVPRISEEGCDDQDHA